MGVAGNIRRQELSCSAICLTAHSAFCEFWWWLGWVLWFSSSPAWHSSGRCMGLTWPLPGGFWASTCPLSAGQAHSLPTSFLSCIDGDESTGAWTPPEPSASESHGPVRLGFAGSGVPELSQAGAARVLGGQALRGWRRLRRPTVALVESALQL